MTLVEHARRELEKLGEDPAMTGCLVATVGAYASFGHSGGSHGIAVQMLYELLNYRPLTPLTADPQEWIDRSDISGTPMWQSERDPRAISLDGGRTYTLVDDPGPGKTLHQSVVPPGWVRALRELNHSSEDDAVAAVWAYLNAGPLDDKDRALLDMANLAERQEYWSRRWGAGAPVAALLYRPGAPAVVGA